MASSFEHLENEMAGLATRLEAMESDWTAEKRAGKRTAGGLIVPAGTQTTDPRLVKFGDDIASLTAKLDQVLAALVNVQRVQRQQQNAIEEMAILGTYTPADKAA